MARICNGNELNKSKLIQQHNLQLNQANLNSIHFVGPITNPRLTNQAYGYYRDIDVHIQENRGFFLLTTQVEYTKTLFAEEKRFAYSSSFCLSFSRSLAHSLPFFLLSFCNHAYVYWNYALVHIRGRVSVSYISSLQLFSLREIDKGLLVLFLHLRVPFLLESLLSFVSALLVRCGSALLIYLILVMRFFAMLLCCDFVASMT